MQTDFAELGGSLHSADIRLVIGTRPEAIKLAPVARALAARAVRPSLILTGQHTDLDPADHGLGAYAATRLNCPGAQDPHSHVKSVAAAVLTQLRKPPDLLVVQGDTSSALGGALAGCIAAVPVAHVEAGLRSHDSAMPWPEEEYRTAIDANPDLLFAPTALAAANLRKERVPGAIFVTGNTGIDAVLKTRAGLPAPSLRDRALPRLLVTCHRRENWGEGSARSRRRCASSRRKAPPASRSCCTPIRMFPGPWNGCSAAALRSLWCRRAAIAGSSPGCASAT